MAASQQPERARSKPERLCSGCGYDLRGSRPGGRCPECGLPIVLLVRRDGTLSRMPMEMIKTFRRASLLASACLLVPLVVVLSGVWTRLPARHDVLGAALVALAVAWVVSVVLLTPAFVAPEAVERGFTGRSRRRRVARWLQGGWVLAAGAFLAMWFTPPGAVPALRVVAWIGFVIGMAGLVALALQLQALAEWVCDDGSAAAFNVAVWAIPVTTAAVFLLDTPFLLIGLILGVLWVAAVGAFPYALLTLSRSIAWSVRHAQEYQERERRRRDREDAETQRVADTLRRGDEIRERRESTS